MGGLRIATENWVWSAPLQSLETFACAVGGLGTGTRILNQANIVFDVNAPILTPVVT